MQLISGGEGSKPKQLDARTQPADHHAHDMVKSLQVDVRTSKLSQVKSYLMIQLGLIQSLQLILIELCTLIQLGDNIIICKYQIDPSFSKELLPKGCAPVSWCCCSRGHTPLQSPGPHIQEELCGQGVPSSFVICLHRKDPPQPPPQSQTWPNQREASLHLNKCIVFSNG